MRVVRLCSRQYVSFEIAEQHLSFLSVMRLLLCFWHNEGLFLNKKCATGTKSYGKEGKFLC